MQGRDLPAGIEGELIMGELRVALIGCGRIGRMHAANLTSHSTLELASVFDAVPQMAREVASTYGVSTAANAEEIFKSTEIDAVLVASTTDTHADYIEMSVAAGKPVLCEKPIDLDIRRVNSCAEIVSRSDVPVQIGFNRRFDPGHDAARSAANAGKIGALRQVMITSRDPEMPSRDYYRTAGGILRDMTIHDFDLARFFLGCEPVEVFAIGGRLVDLEFMEELDDHDSAMIVMRTEDGKQCHINNFRHAVYGYDQRVELVGSEGMLISGNRKPHEATLYTGATTNAGEPYLNFFIERYAEAFERELTAFAHCVLNGSKPTPNFEDGRRALLLAEACYISIAEGRLVKVSEVE